MKHQFFLAFLVLDMGIGVFSIRQFASTTQEISTRLSRREPGIFASKAASRDPDSGFARAQKTRQNSGQLPLSRDNSFDSTATSRTASPRPPFRSSHDLTTPIIAARVEGPAYVRSTKGRSPSARVFDSFHKVKKGEVRQLTWLHDQRVAVHIENKSGSSSQHSIAASGKWTGASITAGKGAQGTLTANTHLDREWAFHNGIDETKSIGVQAWQQPENGHARAGSVLQGKGKTFIFADREAPPAERIKPTHLQSSVT